MILKKYRKNHNHRIACKWYQEEEFVGWKSSFKEQMLQVVTLLSGFSSFRYCSRLNAIRIIAEFSLQNNLKLGH